MSADILCRSSGATPALPTPTSRVAAFPQELRQRLPTSQDRLPCSPVKACRLAAQDAFLWLDPGRKAGSGCLFAERYVQLPGIRSTLSRAVAARLSR